MSKPTASTVAAKSVQVAAEGHTYAEMDCQAFVEYCVTACGGSMAYAGSNDMARNVAYLATIENAKAEGRLVPGAGLLIHEDDESGLPSKYKGDGLGDFSHVGFYVGENALTDTDKSGKSRKCNTVHSSASRGRVVGGTTSGGWTHVCWFKEIDYGTDASALVVGGTLTDEDTAKEDPEGLGASSTATASGPVNTTGFYPIKRGCKGGAVRRLQTWLNDLNGGEELLKDGDFGPATETAVKAFQQAHELEVDGKVGPKTWAALAQARYAAMGASADKGTQVACGVITEDDQEAETGSYDAVETQADAKTDLTVG